MPAENISQGIEGRITDPQERKGQVVQKGIVPEVIATSILLRKDTQWREKMACSTADDIFFAPFEGEKVAKKKSRENKAVKICFQCSVRQQCLAESLIFDPSEEKDGVFGGLREDERALWEKTLFTREEKALAVQADPQRKGLEDRGERTNNTPLFKTIANGILSHKAFQEIARDILGALSNTELQPVIKTIKRQLKKERMYQHRDPKPENRKIETVAYTGKAKRVSWNRKIDLPEGLFKDTELPPEVIKERKRNEREERLRSESLKRKNRVSLHKSRTVSKVETAAKANLKKAKLKENVEALTEESSLGELIQVVRFLFGHSQGYYHNQDATLPRQARWSLIENGKYLPSREVAEQIVKAFTLDPQWEPDSRYAALLAASLKKISEIVVEEQQSPAPSQKLAKQEKQKRVDNSLARENAETSENMPAKVNKKIPKKETEDKRKRVATPELLAELTEDAPFGEIVKAIRIAQGKRQGDLKSKISPTLLPDIENCTKLPTIVQAEAIASFLASDPTWDPHSRYAKILFDSVVRVFQDPEKNLKRKEKRLSVKGRKAGVQLLYQRGIGPALIAAYMGITKKDARNDLIVYKQKEKRMQSSAEIVFPVAETDRPASPDAMHATIPITIVDLPETTSSDHALAGEASESLVWLLEEYGRVLRSVRTERQLYQAGLAQRIKRSPSAISYLENGKLEPTLRMTYLLITALHIEGSPEADLLLDITRKVQPVRSRLTKFQLKENVSVGELERMSLGIVGAILRDERGMEEAELAEKTGLSRNTIANFERGVYIPQLSVIKKILAGLDLSEESYIGKLLLQKRAAAEKSNTEIARQQEVLVAYLRKYNKGRLSDFMNLFPSGLTKQQIVNRLKALKKIGAIYLDGHPKANTSVWRLTE